MTLKNTQRLPPETLPVLQEHVAVLMACLAANLVGVYVHGSAAMGGFVSQQSDLDYLVLVANPLTAAERRMLADAYVQLHGTSGFRKGVEMSIVEARFAGAEFRYPTPYEFHMGSLEQVRHHSEPHTHEHLDPDLASHFTVAATRGVCVYGAEIDAAFVPVDRKYFWLSNYADVSVARESILRDPVYTILNLCRTVCGMRTGDVYSKQEGAALFLADARDFRTLVETALADYRTATISQYDADETARFVDAMLAEVETRLAVFTR